MNISLSPFAPAKLVSRNGLGIPVPRQYDISILRLNMLLTHGIPPDFRDDVHLCIYNRHTPSGQSRVYRVTQLLRTNGVHFRESAGTGPVNLKVVPNGCCLGRLGHHGPTNVRISFPTPTFGMKWACCSSPYSG